MVVNPNRKRARLLQVLYRHAVAQMADGYQSSKLVTCCNLLYSKLKRYQVQARAAIQLDLWKKQQ